ncbi:SAM-dependent methyltransferase [Streptomyces sp900105245]|uniref:class I SAM-dependent methyltransferase n=1 Tax=Streptomyces sp. 900105245 TaxID=3154379 RepID=UPI003323794A
MTTTQPPSHAARAHSFNAAAAQYAANRPSYPPALFDTVEELAGRSLSGARVVDVGAGTGIATALLHGRGADVLAVEPGAGMAAEFRRALPHTDPARAVPEALRVLRPGGSLALWWNGDALDVPWLVEAAGRIGRFLGTDIVAQQRDGTRPELADPSGRLGFSRRVVRWSRRVPVDTHLANIGSHSAFLLTPEDSRNAFLQAERGHLLEVFPDGVVEEVYDVLLLLATKS